MRKKKAAKQIEKKNSKDALNIALLFSPHSSPRTQTMTKITFSD